MVISREEFDKYKELEKKNAKLMEENGELKLIKNNAIVVNVINWDSGDNTRFGFNYLEKGIIKIKSEDISNSTLLRLETQLTPKLAKYVEEHGAWRTLRNLKDDILGLDTNMFGRVNMTDIKKTIEKY